MQQIIVRSFAICLLAIALISELITSPSLAEENSVTQSNFQVRPILSDKCFLCHGPDPGTREADLRLDTQAGIVSAFGTQGLQDSHAWDRIVSDDPDEQMPPSDSGKEITAAERKILKQWGADGAPWSDHWAFVAPQKPTPPKISGKHVSPIDAFVRQRLVELDLSPSLPANKETLIRRLAFDLIGLPPTQNELDDFIADESPNAYEKLVDRMLASPHYGERWAIDWLDGARYADTNGYQNDFARQMWPWRDWVINALNANMPFDQFTIEQLAGDLLPNPTRDQLIATGFHRNNRTVTESGSFPAEWLVENVVDRVETTNTVWLGLTMGCSRCHDHKYDPITQQDFYSFFAFFNNVAEKGVYNEVKGNVAPTLSLPTPEQEQQLVDFDEELANLQREVNAAKQKPKVPKSAVSVSAQRSPKTIQKEIKQLKKRRTKFRNQVQTTMIMRERKKVRPTFVLHRGEYDKPDHEQPIGPNVPHFLPSLPKSNARNSRLALAKWLVSPKNPLTARVQVNRIWQHLFGIGIVKTTENFGVQGELPSHPQLLDWLATKFVTLGWNQKQLIKTIVMSDTYRQSSKVSAELVKLDPENRLLARGPRFRLSAELLRDNALSVSGLISLKVGGPSVSPYQPPNLWMELAGGANDGPYKQSHNANLYRRSLYTVRKRTVPHPTSATFDAPGYDICQVRRGRTNTPLQALALLNDTTYVEAARKLGERMLHEGGNTPRDRIIHGFQLATCRRPSSTELTSLIHGLKRYQQYFDANPQAAEKLLSHGESTSKASFPIVEQAAYATLGTLLLNLDETVTKE